MNRGFLMLAQNGKDDYVLQACLCAMSILVTNPGSKISLVTNDEVPEEYQKLFDQIIEIPWGDAAESSEWKIENRWKLYHVTPYDETIVLDTDMLVLQDISSWWKFLENYDLFFVNDVYTYRNEIVTENYYRKAFEANELPNLYSGFHYFKKSECAYHFYKWAELITNNWELFYGQFVSYYYPSRASMDVTMSIAAKIMNIENDIINRNIKYPTFVHMKPHVQNWIEVPEKWQDRVRVYFTDDLELIVGNYTQQGIFHYTESNFVTPEIIDKYLRKLA